ncbi:neural proliferation differentiation and control protein 1a [Colossoma macropomum]|uniref:neural proliferation differentiation and control protein 1a n=1 Tax=Colossoma macropomum TaxID=42526 RepID=UPI00186497FE|nr:neural proliferation differentiation and control protein 1a [Colossoma macropomum]
MLLPRRGGGLPGAWRLPGLLFCLALAAVGASVPVDNCPDHIDCARVGRQFCTPGSSKCGPCLARLEEDEEGNCVTPEKRHSHHGKETSLPDLDEEIDYLSSIIAKQQVSHVKKPVSPSWSALQFQSEEKNGQSRLKSASQTTTAKPTTHSPSTAAQHTSKSPEPRTDSSGRGKPIAIPFPRDSMLVLLMSVCIIMGTVALILAAVCWVRLQREAHLAQKVDYPAFQAAGPKSSSGISSGDNKLAHSAQMYHYQHQKQQMLSMEKNKTEPKVSESGATSDEETEEGDFTVYECPGLAPTGEMEVKNPLFDDSTLHRERNHK